MSGGGGGPNPFDSAQAGSPEEQAKALIAEAQQRLEQDRRMLARSHNIFLIVSRITLLLMMVAAAATFTLYDRTGDYIWAFAAITGFTLAGVFAGYLLFGRDTW